MPAPNTKKNTMTSAISLNVWLSVKSIHATHTNAEAQIRQAIPRIKVKTGGRFCDLGFN